MRKTASKRQSRKDPQGKATHPILHNTPPLFIGAHADYRREDYVFPRTQSPALKALEWESRLEPYRPWAANAVANLAWDIFA
jgi:hypothetical protein